MKFPASHRSKKIYLCILHVSRIEVYHSDFDFSAGFSPLRRERESGIKIAPRQAESSVLLDN